MRIINQLKGFSAPAGAKLSLALGNFDGVHLAHQSLLKWTVDYARKTKGISAVFTFSIHPQCVLHPASCPPILTTVEHKLALFEKLDIDICFLIDFTSEFSKQTAETFVEKVLVQQLQVDQVCMGYNARFGKNRSGDIETMHQLADRFGFRFHPVSPLQYENEAVSSSLIRQYLQAGRLDKASGMCGRAYAIWAEVVKGDGRGKQLGFPTANLVTPELLPPAGVYAVEVCRTEQIGSELRRAVTPSYRGVLNYGTRPTFGTAAPVCEVHLLDFKEDLYGAVLEVRFLKRIRDEKKFSGPDELKRQIAQDIRDAGFPS